jgi:hypothetical protein
MCFAWENACIARPKSRQATTPVLFMSQLQKVKVRTTRYQGFIGSAIVQDLIGAGQQVTARPRPGGAVAPQVRSEWKEDPSGATMGAPS